MSSPQNPPVQMGIQAAGGIDHSDPGLLKRFLRAYRKASGGSLLLSIVIHAIIIGIGAVLVVSQVAEERKISFGGGDPGPKGEIEHKVQMKRKTTSAPAPTKRITTTSSMARVALPDMPDIPMNMGPSIAGAMGAGGFGASTGLGGGGKGGGSGNGFSKMTFFGLRGGTGTDGFVGTFYDLKQRPNGSPTKMAVTPAEIAAPNSVVQGPANTEYREAVIKFSKGWSKSLLENFFTAPQKLVNYQFIIPRMGADAAPAAYGVEKECAPRRWLACYTATIIPPRSGRFRFRGRGDDILLVRCDGQDVLDGSLHILWKNANTVEAGPPSELFAAGKWINMNKGSPIKMEVAIGECPGGVFYAFLCIEEDGVKYPAGFPVFQLKDAPLPPVGGFPVGKETMIFGVKPASL